MDDIEDCFVKFFLQQAVEIEPDTIQALIDHGFKTKISIQALDLIHDLPQITEVSLGQKAILRKYIGTLQESTPLQLAINTEVVKKYKDPANKPSKKRKLEAIDPDSSDESSEDSVVEYFKRVNSHSQQGHRFTTSMTRVNVPAFQFNRNAGQSPGRQAFNGIVLPGTPMPPRLQSPKYKPIKSPQKEQEPEVDADMPTEEEEVEEEVVTVEPPTKRVGRNRTTKKEIVRTKSQILYEQMKQAKSPQPAAVKKEKEEVEEAPVKVTLGRRSLALTPRTPSNRRATISSNGRISKADAGKSTPIAEEETASSSGHIPTPAELAIRAKIEAKKAADSAKGKRRASKKY